MKYKNNFCFVTLKNNNKQRRKYSKFQLKGKMHILLGVQRNISAVTNPVFLQFTAIRIW